jgi:hypothetical protein
MTTACNNCKKCVPLKKLFECAFCKKNEDTDEDEDEDEDEDLVETTDLIETKDLVEDEDLVETKDLVEVKDLVEDVKPETRRMYRNSLL